MTAPIKQASFAAGEVTPALYARTDISRYEIGLSTMRNFIAMKQGGATQRPGTQYIGTALNGGSQVRLIPFIFNETGTGQSYVLEFGNRYIAFYQNGGVVTFGIVPYMIPSPYLQADLQDLRYAQCADIVTITHRNYPIYELRRLGPTNWTLTSVSNFGPSIANPIVSSTTGGGGINFVVYIVTAVNSKGEESNYNNRTFWGGGARGPGTLAAPIVITWPAVVGATYYRIYTAAGKLHPGGGSLDIAGGIGYIGQTINTTFSDPGFTPDYTQAPPIPSVEFSSANNYPANVGFIQQRRVFANTINNPVGFWMSKPGSFSNFFVSFPSKDDDAIIQTLFSEEVNAIASIVESKAFLLLTAGAEIYVQGNGNGVVTPSGINAVTQSQYGANNIKPLKVGDNIVFIQALSNFIRDLTFDFAVDGYRGNDLTIFSQHLFEGYQIVDWAYQKWPDSIIWAVRSDGVLLGCTYIREQQMLAWHRHDFMNGFNERKGFVENICSIPENGEYAVYAVIRRIINDQTVRYVERLSSRIWKDENSVFPTNDPINASYLDCFLKYNGNNKTPSVQLTLKTFGTDPFSTDDTAYLQNMNLFGPAIFTPDLVGKCIFLNDAEWISSGGISGNQIRLTILSYISSSILLVVPDKIVIPEFQNTPIPNWAIAIKDVGGLGHLIGQRVSVWADRYVVGSPLKDDPVSKLYQVPSSGIISLDKWYSVIYVGLPIVADIQTLDMDTSSGETELVRRKLISTVGVYVYNTRTFFVGGENPDTNKNNSREDALFQLEEFKRGASMSSYDEPPELVTDQDYVITTSRWDKNGRIFIRNIDPCPCTILAISPMGQDPIQQPQGKRV